MSQLIYASLYECDSCGKTANVPIPSKINWSQTPTPPGWASSTIHNIQMRTSTSGEIITPDLCDDCSQLPLETALANIIRLRSSV